MTKLTLISAPTCPYVQRAVIALKEKGADFEVVYVDLMDRPAWFVALSPLGKVPVLKVERSGQPDAVLFESSVIVEYLEETSSGPRLHPTDPLERAQNRGWMEFGSTLLGDLFRLVAAKTDEELAAGRAVIESKLARLEAILDAGPYFNGPAFSCVDAVFAPLFRQVDLIEGQAGRPIFGEFPKVTAWRAALADRPSVRDAVPDDYAQRYLGRLATLESRLLAAA